MSQLTLALALLIVAGLAIRTMVAITNISPLDPLTFVGGTAVLIVIAMAASVFPIRRATHVDPIRALRTE